MTKQPEFTNPDLVELAEAFRIAKRNAVEWETERKVHQARLIDAMAAAGKTEAQYSPKPGAVNKVKVVESSTLKYDEGGLASSLTNEIWERISVRKLDTSLLESAVALGLIPVETVVEHTEEVPRAPYIKITEGV